MSRILITGENGFVGSNLVENFKNKHKTIFFPKTICSENIKDIQKIASVDILIHCAAKNNIIKSWENYDDLIQSNIESTKLMIDYCIEKNASLIFISSYLYGNTKILPTPETEKLEPSNPYALSKKICEELCLFYRENCGLKVTIIRPFNIYGYSEKKHCLIMSIINQIRSSNKIVVNDLKPKRDFIYIKDFCDLVSKVVDKKIYNEVFNAGSGTSYSISDTINIIQSIYQKKFEIKVSKIKRRNEIFETKADMTKARELLAWKPNWQLVDGVKDILDILR